MNEKPSYLNTGVWEKIVLFGDSLTEFSFGDSCWGSGIASAVQRKCDVLNRGFSGYNTNHAKIILPQVLPEAMAPQVALVTIFFGTNDASMLEQNHIQHVPLDVYESNLKEMIAYLEKIGISKEKIILITPPPVVEELLARECVRAEIPIDRTNKLVGDYSKVCCKVAKNKKVIYIDLWTLMQKEKDWQSFIVDGIHFTKEGGMFLLKRLTEITLRKTEHIPRKFPDWREVSAVHPQRRLNRGVEENQGWPFLDQPLVSWPRVFVLGDSLTQRGYDPGQWLQDLTSFLDRKCDVINRGFAGYNSRWIKTILPTILPESMANSTCVVVIFLGCNDSVNKSSTQHVPIKEFADNIKDIISYMEKIGIPAFNIELVTLPPTNEEAWGKECRKKLGHAINKTNDCNQEYSKAVLDVGTEKGVFTVDLFTSMRKEEDWHQFLAQDGLHLSPKGANFLLRKVWPFIMEKTLVRLPDILPDWKSLEPTKLDTALRTQSDEQPPNAPSIQLQPEDQISNME